MKELDRTALLVVDLQRAFDDAGHWGRRNNPACEANVAALLAAWRDAERPVVFIRHDSDVGGNLGFDVLFVLDAMHTFDRAGPDGTTMTADELARASATNLHGEFATVVATAELTRT